MLELILDIIIVFGILVASFGVAEFNNYRKPKFKYPFKGMFFLVLCLTLLFIS